MKDKLMVLIMKKSINLSKANTKFCLSLHYDGDESYLHVNKTEICKFKSNGNLSWYNFVYEVYQEVL